MSRFEKAVDYNGQALAIYRETKNRKGEAPVLNSTGNAYLALNQIDKAIGYYQQSLAIKRELKDRMGEANSLTNIGIAYSYLGSDLPGADPMRRTRYEKAIVYLEAGAGGSA